MRRRLEEANDQLVQAIAVAEDELAREQLSRVEQTIAGLVTRQQNAIAETKRLDSQREGDASPDVNHQHALRNLASEQRLLADETEQLQPRLSAASAFGFALETASANMRRAGVFLTRGQTMMPTQEAQRTALWPGTDSSRPSSGRHPTDRGGPPGRAATATATAIRRSRAGDRRIETAQASAGSNQRGRRSWSCGEQKRERRRSAKARLLAREQGRLADMVLGLIRPTIQRPEDNADHPRRKIAGGAKITRGSTMMPQFVQKLMIIIGGIPWLPLGCVQQPPARAKAPSKGRSLDQQLLDDLDRANSWQGLPAAKRPSGAVVPSAPGEKSPARSSLDANEAGKHVHRVAESFGPGCPKNAIGRKPHCSS